MQSFRGNEPNRMTDPGNKFSVVTGQSIQTDIHPNWVQIKRDMKSLSLISTGKFTYSFFFQAIFFLSIPFPESLIQYDRIIDNRLKFSVLSRKEL